MIYVTHSKPCRRSKSWPHESVAYLTATSVGELDAVAKKLRLKKADKRLTSKGARFNVSEAKRAAAIVAGAVEVHRDPSY